jgi:L-histidine Nalpha-methyltransferase
LSAEARATAAAAPDQRDAMLADAVAGLSAPRKSLPCKWFYDAEGTRLFEAITRLPEYYPTRTELAILAGSGRDIARAVGPGVAVVEFGPGDGVKAECLLRALDAPAAYVPVDIAPEWLVTAAARVRKAHPSVPVSPVVADFSGPFRLPPHGSGAPLLGFFPGSTIGNFTVPEVVALLRRFRSALGGGARLLLGADLVKDPRVLEAAYDDSAGVTAAFNLNLLRRLNRELGADFDLSGFRHRALWNAAEERVEMHLVARRDQVVRFGGSVFRFAAGESIHTENSHKYRPGGLRALTGAAGWTEEARWTDPDSLFSLCLLGAREG